MGGGDGYAGCRWRMEERGVMGFLVVSRLCRVWSNLGRYLTLADSRPQDCDDSIGVV